MMRIARFFLVLMMAASSACSARSNSPAQSELDEAQLETSVAQTVESFVGSLTENAPSPTAPSPSSTVTSALPMAEAISATICRSGPGDPYVVLGVLEAGEAAEVVGRGEDPDYVVIANPDDEGSCWLWLEFATLSMPIDDLALVEVPPTPTPSQTPTPSVIWQGEWLIWVGPLPLTQYSMTLAHNGTSIAGTFEAGENNTVSLRGTLSADFTYASGTWTSSAGDSGTFEWERRVNINQFVGNLDEGDAAWCGARAGASQPSPCLGP